MLTALQNLNPGILESYLNTRDAEKSGVPKALAVYIDQINFASNLIKKYPSVLSCAKKLRLEFPELSISTCRSRVNDAINFLNTDCTVTAESWNMYFADEMMKLRDVALVAHKFGEARKCMENAHRYRISAAAATINPEATKFKPQIVSPDLKIERMGLDNGGLLKAHNKAMDIISKLDCSEAEKDRLRKEVESECNIQDVDYEE